MNDVREQGLGPALPPAVTKVLFVLILIVLTAWGSPAAGLVAGVLFAVAFTNPFLKFSHVAARRLLQACVVLLGFGMNLPAVLRAGASGALFAAASIGATLLLGFWLGKRLSLNRRTAALISVGTAICGGSAIAAVGSVIAVTEGEIAVSIGTVFLLNAAALYIFPLIGHALHLTPSQFGLWSGIAIHDISSVVGAAMSYGTGSLETATAVKLSRTLWIVPITMAFAMMLGGSQSAQPCSETGQPGKKKVAVPWFIGLFLLASMSRTFVPAVSHWGARIVPVSHAGMTLVLFLIGASLSPRSIRALGWRSVVLGVALWLFISIGSLTAIRLLPAGQGI